MDLFNDVIASLVSVLGFASPKATKPAPVHNSDALNEQLRKKKEQFLSDLKGGTGGWIVVTGNEAGDLDSISSAIGYATLSPDSNIIPLVQTPRDSLHLRPENLLAFSMASLNPEVLLTSSEFAHTTENGPLKYVLVDHNSALPSYSGEVVGILDHHEDEKKHTDANPRIIESVGSCASLITTHFADVWKEDSSDALRSVALLLLSAILIDTGGLKVGGKAVPTDYEAVRLLVPHTGLATGSSMANIEGRVPSDLEQLSRRLLDSKSSVDDLTVTDLLRRDYKEYSISNLRVGLSTVPVGLKVLVKRNMGRFWEDVDSYMKDQKLDVLGVLTSYRSAKRKKHRRQLLFIVQPGHPDVEEKLFTGIGPDKELQCEERRIAGLGTRRGRCWRQGNVKATRKVVAPLVKRLLES